MALSKVGLIDPAIDSVSIRYAANVTGNASVTRSMAVGYTDGRVPQANVDVKGNVYIDGNTHVRDQQILSFGTGKDLQIYHNGSHSYISEEGTGQLYLRTNYLSITNAAGSETMTFFDDDGAVNLYYDGVAKLATTGTGLNVTGIGANVTGNASVTRSLAVGYTDGRVPQANLDVKGNTYISSNVSLGSSINFLDSSSGEIGKAVFGSPGKDLEIYHNGSHSFIADVGTGQLYIDGSAINFTNSLFTEHYMYMTADAQVQLYYDSSKKFETTSTGVAVTGQLDITKSAQAEVRTAGVIGGTGQTTLGTNAYQNTTPQFNFADAQNWSITLANNVSLANPLNAKVGQTGSVFVQQDGIGSQTMSFQKSWIWAADSAPTLTTTASANDRIDYIVQAVYANNMAQGIQAVATLDLK